jgi:hypothetical protein
MRINWRILVAIALILVVLAWAVTSVLPRSYSGANLSFSVGSGPVMVTNPSDEDIPVQLVGGGTRSYTVSSTIEGVSGSSTREGSGRSVTNLFSFTLPPGVSEFTIARGTDVNFTADTSHELDATVQPLGAGEARTTLIVGAVVILGALFYISRLDEHRWIGNLRGKPAVAPPVVESAPAEHGQGRAIRSYGDNRADLSN